ncbi:PREDICTED: uncharacterized membrane protein At3g27390 [Nelumbo nucifera]|uniref:Uncharacterized membrane protein At3g27390 n=1 Tax=Nelumbo nucifera TaxID=4432 RepID=A0A1U7ZV27_NELNU|nr:PREDICTED: uncharacterized membrane protein At3g27390 [Nelumbo nucifera]
MEVPIGFIAKLWRFISFLLFFLFLLILGVLKASIIGPVAAVTILVGNSAVILGLWPAHFLWSYYCLTKTKRIGLVLKILLLVSLPVPLALWPVFGIVGSLLAGIGYGVFKPMVATFEAEGDQITEKLFHCFFDGCWSTIDGSCTVVQDFTDFCFHSYFSYMDDLSEKVPKDKEPMDIRLSMLPSCLLVSLLAIPIDALFITTVALWKSPYMLLIGWKRLFEDLIGREGPFMETVCVPFAGLAIILWPLAVVGAVIGAFFCSFFLGLYSGIIVHQENSLRMGLYYIVSVISLFDEYTNDLLYLREGSCLPRPKYRQSMTSSSKPLDKRISFDNDKNNQKKRDAHTDGKKLVSEQRTLKRTIHQLKPIQVWDWLFKIFEVNGRILLHDGSIDIRDLEKCIGKGKCKKLGIKLPAWSILQCLIASAKTDSSGLLISNEVELTTIDWPKDLVFEWLIGPLLIIKEQIRGLQLDENEESCLRKLIMDYDNERPEDWNDAGFPSDDNVRRAQLQAIFRRLQGIVASLSRMPTFRRRFRNLVRVLYIEALGTGALQGQDGGKLKNRSSGKKPIGHGYDGDKDDQERATEKTDNSGDIV